MSYVFDGVIVGLFFGVIALFVLWLVSFLICSLYYKIKKGDFSADAEKTCLIGIIGAIIVFCFCTGCGIWVQCQDKWVDFYDNDGNIVETYEITDYDTSWFNNSVKFYLEDGRTMVKQDCIYEIRFHEDEVIMFENEF